MIKNTKSPSSILTAVLDCKTQKMYLQIKNVKQFLGVRIKKYSDLKSSAEKSVVCTVENSTASENAKIKSFIIFGNGQGVHFKRTQVMLSRYESESSRNGRNSSPFEQKVSNLKSADKWYITAAQNVILIEIGLKYAEKICRYVFTPKNPRWIYMYSSTGGGDSRGLTVAHKVDVKAIFMCGIIKLQLKSEGRSISSTVLAIQYTIYRICRFRYLSGTAVLLVVTCSNAPARIIRMLIVTFNAFVCRLFIDCISVILSVTPFLFTQKLSMTEYIFASSETDGAVIG